MTSSNNFSDLCHNIRLPVVDLAVETRAHPDWKREREREGSPPQGTYKNGHFLCSFPSGSFSEEQMYASSKQ